TSRRALLSGFLAIPLVPLTSALARGQDAPLLPRTRACEDEDEPTLGREAGPFFRPNAPLKRDLFLDAPDGSPFTIAGYVERATPCCPLISWPCCGSGGSRAASKAAAVYSTHRSCTSRTLWRVSLRLC